MRALVYDGERLRLREDYPPPVLPPSEALVRVHLAGICNTDLEIVRGYMGFRGVLGHEFVGTVVECADKAEGRSLLGRRVVGEINAYCGECPTCRAGNPTHCPNRTTLGIWGRDGAFAEYLTLPIHNLHPLPGGLPDEVAVFTEPLAAALEILEQVHVRPTDRVVVLGDGKLGLLVAQVIGLLGCDLTVVGRHPEKLAILARRSIPTVLADETDGLVADIVVECTGRSEGFATARRLLRPRGVLVLKSTYHGRVEADMTSLVVDEISLVGSRCGPFPPALRLLHQGLVDVRPLISATYPLSQGEEAFARAAESGTLKVLLRIGE
ncbi:MAG TPA: alcohol dehydrogenase [Anaerolineales bacterium]|nr:alcohol dehydrogenase [Anaerolineae bacterium]HIP87752.1 alcohol dehydrogenase [Anaerolineales bacterium]